MNHDALTAAKRAFLMHRGNSDSSIEEAIKVYMVELCKPGELIVGEAIQPQRDYRKELWITASQMHTGTSFEKIDFCNRVVLGFDAFFKANP